MEFNSFQSTRAEIMEKGVALETGISGLLGMLLDIDVDTSLSLGSKNMALGMSQKVNLLCDLKFVPKDIIWQFQLFTAVRNKFAHLQKVDCFVECFEILKEEKKKLLNEFKVEDELKTTSEEIKLSVRFSMLCISISIWLQLILKKTKFSKQDDLNKTAVIELLRDFFKNSKQNEIMIKENFIYLENLIEKISVDENFINSVEEMRNLNKLSDK